MSIFRGLVAVISAPVPNSTGTAAACGEALRDEVNKAQRTGCFRLTMPTEGVHYDGLSNR